MRENEEAELSGWGSAATETTCFPRAAMSTSLGQSLRQAHNLADLSNKFGIILSQPSACHLKRPKGYS